MSEVAPDKIAAWGVTEEKLDEIQNVRMLENSMATHI